MPTAYILLGKVRLKWGVSGWNITWFNFSLLAGGRRSLRLFLFVHSDLNFWVISFVICVGVSLVLYVWLNRCFMFVFCSLCFVLCKCLFAATCCVHGDSWDSRSQWILTPVERFPRPSKRYILDKVPLQSWISLAFVGQWNDMLFGALWSLY